MGEQQELYHTLHDLGEYKAAGWAWHRLLARGMLGVSIAENPAVGAASAYLMALYLLQCTAHLLLHVGIIRTGLPSRD